MRKPSNTLLEAMDQMEQIPGIAGVWSEVRCQTRHTKPMRTPLPLSKMVTISKRFRKTSTMRRQRLPWTCTHMRQIR